MHVNNYSLRRTLGLLFILISICYLHSNAQNGVGVNTNTPKSLFEDNGSFEKKVTIVNISSYQNMTGAGTTTIGIGTRISVVSNGTNWIQF